MFIYHNIWQMGNGLQSVSP